MRHTVRTAGEPAAVKLHCYRSEMKGDGLDIAQIEAEILDEHGNLCVQADTKLTFSVQGPGYAAAVDNGRHGKYEGKLHSCIPRTRAGNHPVG